MIMGKGKNFVKFFPFPIPLPFSKLWVDGKKEKYFYYLIL